MSQNYQAFLDERCEKLGTNHNVNCSNISLISLANCCWKSKIMISPATKKFTNAGHIDAKLIDFSQICQKNPSEISCFLLIVSWRSFHPKFPVKSADFPKNLPRKSFENWLFSAKIPRNGPIFLRILTSLPRKSPEIGRLCREFWLFSCEIGQFFRKFAPENPAKFCFFFREISEALT